MPTLFVIYGLRFYFYSDDHLPIHVHVRNADGRAKIQVQPEIEVMENRGIKPADMKRALVIVRLYQHRIIREWYEHMHEKQ